MKMTSNVFWKQLASIRNVKRAVLNQASPPPQPLKFLLVGFTVCDVTNTGKQLCSPNEPFVVVLEKGFFKNEISPFGVDFEICNFVDRFMPKHTHYTLTKIQKVKKHNRTPLSKTLYSFPYLTEPRLHSNLVRFFTVNYKINFSSKNFTFNIVIFCYYYK